MSDTITAGAGSLERPEDAGKGAGGVVKRWQAALDLADKTEKSWRTESAKLYKRFRNTKAANGAGSSSGFNIFYANVQTQAPALYSETPRPDVRRRWAGADAIGRQVGTVLERSCSYMMDRYGFDGPVQAAVLDELICGRGIVRVRYEPTIGQRPAQMPAQTPPQADGGEDAPAGQNGGPPMEEYIAEQKVCFELVPWARFRRGPGETWKEVEWIAFEHHFARDELVERFGQEIGEKVELDYAPLGEKADQGKRDADLMKKAIVWEIWDRTKREALFVAFSYPDAPLKVTADPLRLEDFYPIPEPLYAIPPVGGDLVPVPDWDQYASQANELDTITARIRRVISAIKVRGIYDSTIKELSQVLQGDRLDNELIPAENVTTLLATKGGTLDAAVWMLPIDRIVTVLAQLIVQRNEIKTSIYEISGISDILRGQGSGPQVTATEQTIKAQWGGLRLQLRQRAVQQFCRSLIMLMAEIIAEHFEPQVLSQMTEIQVTPQMMQLMRNDTMRSYRIDIETNSTIATNEAADKQALGELMTSLSSLGQALPAAVQGGMLSAEGAKVLTLAVIRRFKLGKMVEEVLDQPQEAQQGAQQPDPAQQAAQAQAAAEQQRMQQQAQVEGAKHEAAMQRIAAEAEQSKAEHEMKMREMAAQAEFKAAEHQARMIELQARVGADALAQARSVEQPEAEEVEPAVAMGVEP